MSSRMASKTALNCTSYRFSSSSSLRARWAWDAVIRRSRTKARMISTLMAIARGLFRTPESIATPCSVKAYGAYRLPPRPFEITICDLKDSASAGLRRNMKSPGNRSGSASRTARGHRARVPRLLRLRRARPGLRARAMRRVPVRAPRAVLRGVQEARHRGEAHRGARARGELALLQVKGARGPGRAPEMEPPGWGGGPAPGADSLRAGRPAGRVRSASAAD